MDRFLLWKKQTDSTTTNTVNHNNNNEFNEIQLKFQQFKNLREKYQEEVDREHSISGENVYSMAMTLTHPYHMYNVINDRTPRSYDSKKYEQSDSARAIQDLLQTYMPRIKSACESTNACYSIHFYPNTQSFDRVSCFLENTELARQNGLNSIPKSNKSLRCFAIGNPQTLIITNTVESSPLKEARGKEVFYGSDGTGRLNASMNTESFIQWTRQNSHWAPILLSIGYSPECIISQVYTSFMLLGNGGTLILTMTDLLDPLNHKIISILCNAFDEVIIHKPLVSPGTSDHFNIVASNFQSPSIDIIFQLQKMQVSLVTSVTSMTSMTGVTRETKKDSDFENIDSRLISRISFCLELFLKRQCTAFKDVIEVMTTLRKYGISDPEKLKQWHSVLLSKDPTFKNAVTNASFYER